MSANRTAEIKNTTADRGSDRTGSISALFLRGNVVSGHRSRDEAQGYIADFKRNLALPQPPEPAFDPLLQDFLVEVVLSAGWYQRRCKGAQRRVRFYIALNVLLILLLPVALIGLGALAQRWKAEALAGQVTAVLTGILAMQKSLSTWYSSQVRYAVWYKAGADLKSLYYSFIQNWCGKAAADPIGFVAALKSGTEAARQIVSNEQLDYYQKLALPSFDILDMLTGTRATVSTLVTSLMPGSPTTDVTIAGKNALASAPTIGTSAQQTAADSSVTLPAVSVLADGGAKKRPYTIVIIANPALLPQAQPQSPVADPILSQAAMYQACVRYIRDALFGRLPGQAEQFLAVFEPQIRLISIFDPSLPVDAAVALVAEYPNSDIVQPQQAAFAPLISRYQVSGEPIRADVVFAVTASGSHSRSSAYFTADDKNAAGDTFELDGTTFTHRHENVAPGVVALHVSASSVVALHEFSHAASSWDNGSVTDLYVDNPIEYNPVNLQSGRPIPENFGSYAGTTYKSDTTRACLNGYPAGWNSYHCELVDNRFPALMDDFWSGRGRPEDCRHDKITRDFLTGRLRSIMSRS